MLRGQRYHAHLNMHFSDSYNKNELHFLKFAKLRKYI